MNRSVYFHNYIEKKVLKEAKRKKVSFSKLIEEIIELYFEKYKSEDKPKS